MGGVQKRGGIPKDNVTNDTNYPVVGAIASPDWIVSKFGRRIQKAAEMAKSGKCETAIILEVDWSMALN